MTVALGWLWRIVAGLLLAGLLAPLTLWLPASYQGPLVLGLVTVVSVAITLVLAGRPRPPH